MGLSQEAHDAGQEVAAATGAALPESLNRAVGRFLGPPYRVTSACVVDQDGNRTERLASVAYVASGNASDPEPDCVSADAAAAVLDTCEELDLERLRAAYMRIAQAKRLRKTAVPREERPPRTNVTLGVIFALRSDLPLDDIADELDRLNGQTPGGEWPNMVAVASTGAVNYAVQFPGESSFFGDWLLPAEGELAGSAPPMYIVVVMRPTGTHTFNKVLASVVAHLAIFSPGAKVPNFNEILEGVPQQVMVISGYQYDLGGQLLPVPRQFYSDRYLPPLPWRIENHQGKLLSTLQFLPWQDGGVILLRGEVPLEWLLLVLGKEAQGRTGVFPRPGAQISYVLPITQASFPQVLARIQAANLVVRREQPRLVLQKVSDEGSSSPIMARLLMGVMHLRDQVCPDDVSRKRFDECYELVTSPVLSARTTAQEVVRLYEDHVRRVTSGEIARLRGQMIHVEETIDKELRQQVESFLNTAVRAIKQGMQRVAAELQVDIGFLFQNQTAFARGLAALEVADPALAEYLRKTRTWSHRLVEEGRNALEHEGWTLPRVTYCPSVSGIEVGEPLISGQPICQFVTSMLDRLLCFVEEVTVHCLQRQMPTGITITEIPLAQRLAEAPERFTLTLATGGRRAWQLVYHGSSFEETWALIYLPNQASGGMLEGEAGGSA